MFRKKGFCKVNQIGDDAVLRVCPIRGKFKTMAGFSLGAFAGSSQLLNMVKPGAVRVVLGVGAVRNDKDLHILKKPRSRPKTLLLIAVDLVEGFANGNAPSFYAQYVPAAEPLTSTVTS